jgi:hypothetical protein
MAEACGEEKQNGSPWKTQKASEPLKPMNAGYLLN